MYSARLTSELYYSCSSFKVKGGGVSSCRSASFDLASPVLRVPDLRQEAYMSPLPSLQLIHHYGYSLDFPTRKHTISLTLILRVLEVSSSSCLIIKLSFPSSP